MGRPYPLIIAKRMLAAVESGAFRVIGPQRSLASGVSTAIRWVERLRNTGKRGTEQDRRLQAPRDRGRAPHMASGADQGERLHPARAGGRTRRTRSEG